MRRAAAAAAGTEQSMGAGTSIGGPASAAGSSVSGQLARVVAHAVQHAFVIKVGLAVVEGVDKQVLLLVLRAGHPIGGGEARGASELGWQGG